MGQSIRHDERDCECVQYAPTFKVYEIRANGINYRCRKCNRYVDPAKWFGGVVKFQLRTRLVPANYCPCCGQRMALKRKAKKKLEDSVKHQIAHPEQHDPRATQALIKKSLIIYNDVLTPRVK